MELDKNQVRRVIAKRVALGLKDGGAVSLDIGLPMMIPNYLEPDVHVMLQSENDTIDMGSAPAAGQGDPLWISAGGGVIAAVPEAATFDSATSFGIIRGGHVDVSILDALQIDETGGLANWVIPGKPAPDVGGTMDLLVGTRKVILTMTRAAEGKAKVLEKYTLPLTAASQAGLIITELYVIEVRKGQGLYVIEIRDGVTREEIETATGAALRYADDVKPMRQ